jgi:8-oxo-dGTP pyrophosphatase MutT (NUDIX family)
VALNPALGDVDARSQAVHAALVKLAERGDVRQPRGETYGISESWTAPTRLRLDRGLVPMFGAKSYGVHVNGFVRGDDGLKMWIGRRAPDKRVAPDKLDHMVAGGLAHGYSVDETVVKEAAEEADVPDALARRAKPVGALTYVTELEQGLRDDTLFLFDLELPADFVPRNTDGELTGFELWDVADVMARVRETDDFKFNVAPVLIDFFLRHGLLDPDREPDYLPIVRQLHAGP